MKKILLCSFIFSGLLFANQLSYLPLGKKFLSEENGGDKHILFHLKLEHY